MAHRRVTHLTAIDEKYELLRKNGILMLDGEIDESSANSFCMDAIRIGLSGSFREKSMLVILNSPGGSVEHGFAIHDCIVMLTEGGIKVNVIGLGLVASMGTVILQAGTRRLSAPHTQFLVHQVSQTIGFFKSEEVNELGERAAELERINDIMMRIIANRSGFELTELKEISKKKDYWMGAASALKFGLNGLIDEVTTKPLSDVFPSRQ